VVAGDFEVEALLDAEGSFATYPGAFPEAGEDEWAPWRERHPQLFEGERWRLPFRSFLIRSVALSEERARPLSAGTTAVEGEAGLSPGVVAFETPGHLPGHMSIRIGEELVILGDVSVHPAQFTRPSLVYVSDDAAEPSARTREEMVSAYGDRILACGHFPGSGLRPHAGRHLDAHRVSRVGRRPGTV
jgi:glyoxylase-like metal-dependent hydrolase (beta-lactamase superfamily II)